MIASLATWQYGREKPRLKLKETPPHQIPQKFIYLYIYKLKTPKNLQNKKNKKANNTQILGGLGGRGGGGGGGGYIVNTNFTNLTIKHCIQ